PRGPVATIGPIAVDPRAQGRGIGRRLLERAIELGGRGVPQVRLVHESFNSQALGLYLHAGFRVVAPLLDLELPPVAALPRPSSPRVAWRFARWSPPPTAGWSTDSPPRASASSAPATTWPAAAARRRRRTTC